MQGCVTCLVTRLVALLKPGTASPPCKWGFLLNFKISFVSSLMFSWWNGLCKLHSPACNFELIKAGSFAILQFLWDQPRKKIVGVALPENYTCVIIDDNELDRLMVTTYVKKIPNLQISGIFNSAVEAEQFLENNAVDILLSDIDMPGLNGTDLRKKMMHIP